jgi:hypothetical protein
MGTLHNLQLNSDFKFMHTSTIEKGSMARSTWFEVAGNSNISIKTNNFL